MMPTFRFVSYREFATACYQLVAQIQTAVPQPQIEYLISIQRGGAMMSKILADALDLPIATVVVSSYQDLHQHKQPFISQELAVDVRGKSVLLLDEICDSGDTLALTRQYVLQKGAARAETAVLFLKPAARFQPTYWVNKSSEWVVFPGEVFETARIFTKLPTGDAAVQEQFRQFLLEQGATPDLVHQLSGYQVHESQASS